MTCVCGHGQFDHVLDAASCLVEGCECEQLIVVPVLAHGKWRNNAELMADCFRLGYLDDEHPVWDCTYGMGRFWALRSPLLLIASDIAPAKALDLVCDFTEPPFRARSIHHIVFDPPYKLNGTERYFISEDVYGVARKVRWQDRINLIENGVTRLAQVLGDGYLLVKCQDQVVSGRKRWQTDLVTNAAARQGLRKVDRMDLSSYRSQPAGRTQKHAHVNTSQLLVFSR